MPLMQSQILTEKAELKYLTVLLDEDEEILPSLKQALREAKIDSAKIVACNGLIKEGFMNYFQKSFYKARELKDTRIINGSGRFVDVGEDFTGDLHVIALIGNQCWNGTLVKGTAGKDFSIRIEFIKPLNQ